LYRGCLPLANVRPCCGLASKLTLLSRPERIFELYVSEGDEDAKASYITRISIIIGVLYS
jgi:hypothetical protein